MDGLAQPDAHVDLARVEIFDYEYGPRNPIEDVKGLRKLTNLLKNFTLNSRTIRNPTISSATTTELTMIGYCHFLAAMP